MSQFLFFFMHSYVCLFFFFIYLINLLRTSPYIYKDPTIVLLGPLLFNHQSSRRALHLVSNVWTCLIPFHCVWNIVIPIPHTHQIKECHSSNIEKNPYHHIYLIFTSSNSTRNRKNRSSFPQIWAIKNCIFWM